jgi:hypothetical protein
MYPGLIWTTLHPITAGGAAAAQARSVWARKSRTPAGLWTVERSPTTENLHVNIIHPAGFDAAHPSFHRWQRAITGNVRNVAAYISKPEQFPRHEDHPGRLYGTLGPLWQYLANAQQAPVIAASALEYAIDPGAARARVSNPAPTANGACSPTKEQSRIIAEKYLPTMLRPRVRI